MDEAALGVPPCPACGYVETTRLWLRPPRVNSDLDWQDGRMGDGFFHHGLGKHIRSRRDFASAKAEAREKHYYDTDGAHTTKTPHRVDPKDPGSPVVWEKETFHTNGFDIGELHPVENVPERLNDPMSAFDEGKTLRESEAELERRLA